MRKAPRGGVPAVLLAIAIGVLGSLAFGEAPDATPVKIEIKGYEGCTPNPSDFLDEMTARSKKVRAAKKDDKGKDEKGTKTFKVTIKKDGKKSAGEVVVPTGPFSTKKETAKSGDCDDVVEELAYLAAHSIDPDALVEVPTATPSVTASVAPTVSAAPTTSASAAPVEPADPEKRFRISVGAGAQLVALSAPGVVFTPNFFVEGSMGGKELIAPSLRLSFVRAKGGQIETPVGNGYFKWLWADLDACPLYLGLTPTVSFRPCLGFEFGQIEGVGGQVPTLPGAVSPATSRTEPRLWFATRLLGRIQFFPIDRLFFELQAGLTIPFTRDEFIFGFNTTIYKAPVVMPFVGLDVGVRF